MDTPCELPFVFGNSSKSSHIARPEDAKHTISIPCKTLDSIIEDAGITSLRLVKLDVEGAESKALLGAEKTIRRFLPHLVIELHTPEQDLTVARLLTEWGYLIKRLEGPEIIHLDRAWPDPNGVWGTIHATPKPQQ